MATSDRGRGGEVAQKTQVSLRALIDGKWSDTDD